MGVNATYVDDDRLCCGSSRQGSSSSTNITCKLWAVQRNLFLLMLVLLPSLPEKVCSNAWVWAEGVVLAAYPDEESYVHLAFCIHWAFGEPEKATIQIESSYSIGIPNQSLGEKFLEAWKYSPVDCVPTSLFLHLFFGARPHLLRIIQKYLSNRVKDTKTGVWLSRTSHYLLLWPKLCWANWIVAPNSGLHPFF